MITRRANAWQATANSARATAGEYELSNHLGNVYLVVSGMKFGKDTTADGRADYYVVDIKSASDYYAFGANIPGRSYSSGSYRYGFNGKEKDNEIKGEGNSYDFGARMYDSRLGRWMSVDPLAVKYPQLSPYNFVANNPILLIDPDGKQITIHYRDDKGKKQTLIFVPGEKYTGTNQFVKDVYDTYEYLNSKGAADVITELANRKENVDLHEQTKFGAEQTGFDFNKMRIDYNPKEGLLLKDNEGKETGEKQSPALGLLHEASHALQAIENEEKFIKDATTEITEGEDKVYHTPEEKRVITEVETPAAQKLGEGVRTNHKGKAFEAKGVSSTEEVKKTE